MRQLFDVTVSGPGYHDVQRIAAVDADAARARLEEDIRTPYRDVPWMSARAGWMTVTARPALMATGYSNVLGADGLPLPLEQLAAE